MFNAARAHARYQQVFDLPDPALRQEWLQRLDHGFLNLLTQQGILSECPRVEVRFDESGSHVRTALGMPGSGLITMGGNDKGHVAGADNQPLDDASGVDPIWHRWGVLLHGAAHTAFETLSQAFIPEAFSPAMTQVLNTHVFALFLTNPQRKAFEEAFADCFSSLVLLSTQTPEAMAEVEALRAARQRTRHQYEALWEDDPEQAERHVHLSDLALRRALSQPQPIASEDLISCALHCASDGLVDLWRMDPQRAQEALERSWTQLDPMYAASRVRRALEGGYNLADAWGRAYPNHPLVRLWGPLTREAQGAQINPDDYAMTADPQWKQAWVELFRCASPAIEHALEGHRAALGRVLQPPPLALHQRRMPAMGRGAR